MPTTATELNNHRSWATHHDKNPKWPSERKAEAEKQARKTALAQIKARRANRVAAAANVDSTAAPSVYKSMHEKDTSRVEVGKASSSNIDTTVSTSSFRRSVTRRSSSFSAASSKSQAPISTRKLQSTGIAAVRTKAVARSHKAALASSMFPAKPLPSATSLDSMFDDENDVGRVYSSEGDKSGVETSNHASAAPSKKRKLPFGDEDSEGESDFEDLHRSDKPKTCTVDLDVGKHKHEKSAVMPHASALVSGTACHNQDAVLNLMGRIQPWQSVGNTSSPSAKPGIAPALNKIISTTLKDALHSFIQ